MCGCMCYQIEYPRYADTDGVQICDWCSGKVEGWEACTVVLEEEQKHRCLCCKREWECQLKGCLTPCISPPFLLCFTCHNKTQDEEEAEQQAIKLEYMKGSRE